MGRPAPCEAPSASAPSSPSLYVLLHFVLVGLKILKVHILHVEAEVGASDAQRNLATDNAQNDGNAHHLLDNEDEEETARCHVDGRLSPMHEQEAEN